MLTVSKQFLNKPKKYVVPIPTQNLYDWGCEEFPEVIEESEPVGNTEDVDKGMAMTFKD